MSLGEATHGRSRFVWDDARVHEVHDGLFDPQWWRQQGNLTGEARGRGTAWFVDGLDGQPWVLRHNRRGGLLARINHDRFLWSGAKRARSLEELRLLAVLHEKGLPVPAPVAARAEPRGLIYRGDVITERITGAMPLGDRLLREPIPATAWQTLGGVLARFHRVGLWHADLNARNVLVDAADDFHLIDLDKARLRSIGRWRQANLARLGRSLEKFRSAHHEFCFADTDWIALRGGYQAEFAAGLTRGLR